MEKGKAGHWGVFAVWNSTSGGGTIGSGVTAQGGNITANLLIDGATSGAAITDTNPSEQGGGAYVFSTTTAETDCTMMTLVPECSTNYVEVIPMPRFVYTRPANFSVLSVATSGNANTDVKINSDKTGYTLSSGPLTSAQTNTIMAGALSDYNTATSLNVTASTGTIQADIAGLSFATTGQGDTIQADIAALSFATTGQGDAIQADIAALSFATTSQAGSIETKIDSLISTAGVQTSCAAALVSYDPPTRTELTTDKEEILAGITAGTGSTAASITAATDVIAANITAGTGTIQTDIAALNNLSSSEVSTTVSALLVSTPITSGGAPTSATFGDYIMKTKYVIVNDLDIDETTGEAIVNNDAGDSVSTTGTFTTLAGITSRTKLI